jgi:hypothetical protein
LGYYEEGIRMVIPYDFRYNGSYLTVRDMEKNRMAETKTQKKKEIVFSWTKFLAGAKRPLIALIVALLLAFGFQVDELTSGMIGLIVERIFATIEWHLNNK